MSTNAQSPATIDLADHQVTTYSTYPEVQASFERMVALSVKVATALRSAAPGSVAVIYGYSYWVSDAFKADEPMIVMAGPGAYEPTEDEYPQFPSQCEGLGENELDEISAEVERWLASPTFESVNQSVLDSVSMKTALSWSGHASDRQGMQILDFTNATFGLLVTRSAHWLKNRCGDKDGQLGIVVERKFYLDACNTPICWPVVHWEGEVGSSTCNPVNVVPFRAHELPFITFVE